MIDTYATERSNECKHIPLCRSYLAAYFDTADIEVQETAAPLSAHWGFGTLADGQIEVLGVWVEARGAAVPWQRISHDLWVRGVERIRFLIASQASDLTIQFPGATVLVSPKDAPVLGLSQRLRRIVLDGESVSRRMRNSLRRAVGLYGAFADRETAATFLSQVLERSERRLTKSLT